MFIDRVTVRLRAGNGGAGVASFLRTKGKPKGRPDGGNGGKGGDVLLRADPSVSTLLRYKRNPHYKAENGTHGEGDLRHGRQGKDLVLSVPLGTIVSEPAGTVLADLVQPGHQVTVLKGGRGGRGNAAFVSPRLKAPSVAEQGEYGVETPFVLELKLLADAALIGFPNAGKSTIISSVSASKSKVGDYPFTTLEPHLGMVAIDDREFIMADIPGLIAGAAQGKGLGHEFLRHVERARVMVFVLDPSPLQPEPVDRQLEILAKELEDFLPELALRPRLLIISKGDLPEAKSSQQLVPEAMIVSVVTGLGVEKFLHATADLVDQAVKASPDRPGFVLYRPVVSDLRVEREGDAWRVEGMSAYRAVAFADLNNPDAARLAAERLSRVGVDAALLSAGASPGDEVRIGELVMEFTVPEDEDE